MRTVMAFATLGTGMILTLDSAPPGVAGQGQPQPIVLPDGTPQGTQALGSALAVLLTGHPAVQNAITAALLTRRDDPPSPLYFDVRATAADALMWEALFLGAPVGFCALDGRWPVGRIATQRSELPARTFVPPLRIVAVLAANGRRGLPQFQALLAAVTAARPAGSIPAVLHVIVSEDEVFAAATEAANTDPRVTVERIAGNALAIAAQIKAAHPHVLHVLSHGGLLAGVWTLFLATAADDVPGADPLQRGSVPLSADRLTDALRESDPWLVVLGACATAAADEGPALANVIASDVPAVVGMRRMVDLMAMDRFCRELFPQVLAMADEALVLGRHVILDWAAALSNPRAVLSEPDPTQSDAWTDPVLYAQSQPLQVMLTQDPAAPAAPQPDVITVPAPPSPQVLALAEQQGELARWRSFLATLDASAPPTLVADVRDTIAKLEAELGGAV